MDVLSTLTPREEKVLKLRFGIEDGLSLIHIWPCAPRSMSWRTAMSRRGRCWRRCVRRLSAGTMT